MENKPVVGLQKPILDSLSEWQTRLKVVVGTIIAGMLITGLLISPIVLSLPAIWLIFPAGLYFLTHNTYGTDYTLAINEGWLLYALIVILATLSRNRKIFFVIYTILIIVLLLNFKGCTQTPGGPM
jgi:hypothetical protein